MGTRRSGGKVESKFRRRKRGRNDRASSGVFISEGDDEDMVEFAGTKRGKPFSEVEYGVGGPPMRIGNEGNEV